MKYIVHFRGHKIIAVSSYGLDTQSSASSFEIDSDLSDIEILTKFIAVNNTLVFVGEAPSAFHELNDSLQWVVNLTKAKEAKRGEIKQARTQAEYAGFNWDGSAFDSDVVSQGRITGAVTLALIALQAQQPYEVTWTLANRTFRTLSAQELMSVGIALGTHVQTNFNKGQALQVQIDAATTKEELDLITW